MRILVTGASGFIGSFIVERGLAEGHEMWAGMRRTSSKRWLQLAGIRFVELDLMDTDVLRKQLAACKKEFGGWDVVVHAAGATKCVRERDFYRVNTEGTCRLTDSLMALDMVPKRFIFISTLSVFGAVREKPARKEGFPIYEPIRAGDEPHPNTAYGKSKLLAERHIKSLRGFPYVILRPTGVYGPREKDYYLMAQSIQRHVDFGVGYKPQEITFVYVKDLVEAVYLAMEKDVVGEEFFISDGRVYHSDDFSDLICKELGHPFVLRVKAPVWLLRVLCEVCGSAAAWRGKVTTLNSDKFFILKQRNWQCDNVPAAERLGFRPRYLLAEGVKETIAWYKKEGWL